MVYEQRIAMKTVGKRLATLADLERITSELMDHSNSQFRWLVGLLIVLVVAAIGILLRTIG